jgi:hypothetical protein
MSIFKITRETKIILIFVICICITGFAIAFFYYDSVNNSEDPRILQTKFMLVRFDKLMKGKNYTETFPLLDSIEQYFMKVPGYSESYEPGIIYNNRASVYISMALYGNSDSLEKQNLLKLAKYNTDTCISIYKKWIEKMGNLNKSELIQNIIPFFKENDAAFKNKNFPGILNKRVEDLILAQKETPRRLSVSYTNLGIIQRHQFLQKEAVESYLKALKLWKDNFTARNNLNVLYGKQPEDRSIIDKLFPPDKNK